MAHSVGLVFAFIKFRPFAQHFDLRSAPGVFVPESLVSTLFCAICFNFFPVDADETNQTWNIVFKGNLRFASFDVAVDGCRSWGNV